MGDLSDAKLIEGLARRVDGWKHNDGHRAWVNVPLRELRAVLREALAGPPERERWVLVPREPTPAMFQAVYDQHCSKLDDMWTAMLSAAPKPEAAG